MSFQKQFLVVLAIHWIGMVHFCAAKRISMKINLGGAHEGEFVPEDGVVEFDPDMPKMRFHGDIKGVGDDIEVFKTQRFTRGQDLVLKVLVPDGVYSVTLLFAETWNGAFQRGVRMFDVYVGSSPSGVAKVIQSLDMFGTAGGATPIRKKFKGITARDGITIALRPVKQNPQIAGIVVEGHSYQNTVLDELPRVPTDPSLSHPDFSAVSRIAPQMNVDPALLYDPNADPKYRKSGAEIAHQAFSQAAAPLPGVYSQGPSHDAAFGQGMGSLPGARNMGSFTQMDASAAMAASVSGHAPSPAGFGSSPSLASYGGVNTAYRANLAHSQGFRRRILQTGSNLARYSGYGSGANRRVVSRSQESAYHSRGLTNPSPNQMPSADVSPHSLSSASHARARGNPNLADAQRYGHPSARDYSHLRGDSSRKYLSDGNIDPQAAPSLRGDYSDTSRSYVSDPSAYHSNPDMSPRTSESQSHNSHEGYQNLSSGDTVSDDTVDRRIAYAEQPTTGSSNVEGEDSSASSQIVQAENGDFAKQGYEPLRRDELVQVGSHYSRGFVDAKSAIEPNNDSHSPGQGTVSQPGIVPTMVKSGNMLSSDIAVHSPTIHDQNTRVSEDMAMNEVLGHHEQVLSSRYSTDPSRRERLHQYRSEATQNYGPSAQLSRQNLLSTGINSATLSDGGIDGQGDELSQRKEMVGSELNNDQDHISSEITGKSRSGMRQEASQVSPRTEYAADGNYAAQLGRTEPYTHVGISHPGSRLDGVCINNSTHCSCGVTQPNMDDECLFIVSEASDPKLCRRDHCNAQFMCGCASAASLLCERKAVHSILIEIHSADPIVTGDPTIVSCVRQETEYAMTVLEPVSGGE